MKIFVVVDNWNLIPLFYEKTKIKLNVMISYHYLRGQASKLTMEYRDMIGPLYLDSGAFSASTGRSKITVREYLGYVKSYGRFFNALFSFDDDFEDPEHNEDNQSILEEGLAGTGIKVIPVVHDVEDPYREFQKYVDLGHDYIAIGSNKKLSDDVFEKIKKTYPEVKIHMFGTLDRDMLRKHKPYSADASSYAKEAGTGEILYWDPIDKKEYKIYDGKRDKKQGGFIHFQKFHHKAELEKMLHDFGYTYQKILTSSEAEWVVNMFFYTQLEKAINQSP